MDKPDDHLHKVSPECSKPKPPKEPDDKVTLEPRDGISAAFIPEEWAAQYIQVMTTPSQQFAQQVQLDTSEQSFTDLVPEAYRDFEDVFSKVSGPVPGRSPGRQGSEWTLETGRPL